MSGFLEILHCKFVVFLFKIYMSDVIESFGSVDVSLFVMDLLLDVETALKVVESIAVVALIIIHQSDVVES